MNNLELERLLEGYPVQVCAANQIRKQKGKFVIANTDTSDGPGKHWVTFYFPKQGPYEFFDSLGKKPNDYNVGFETVLTNKFWMVCDPIQDTKSDTCGLYCVYYIITKCTGRTIKDIVKPFNVYNRQWNDIYVKNVVNKHKL
jgi:hypothetical protein